MKSLRREILEFVSTISKKEIAENKDLRSKLKELNRHLRKKYSSNNGEMLKFLNAELLNSNLK